MYVCLNVHFLYKSNTSASYCRQCHVITVLGHVLIIFNISTEIFGSARLVNYWQVKDSFRIAWLVNTNSCCVEARSFPLRMSHALGRKEGWGRVPTYRTKFVLFRLFDSNYQAVYKICNQQFACFLMWGCITCHICQYVVGWTLVLDFSGAPVMFLSLEAAAFEVAAMVSGVLAEALQVMLSH